MTAWSFPVRSGQLVDVDGTECRRLLTSAGVGRLGFRTPQGPRIVPLNYALLPDAVAFRTRATTEIGQYGPGQLVAFEVDDFDEFLRTGWSVLIIGELRTLSAEAVEFLTVRQTADLWVDGDRSMFCSVDLATMTGRRVLPS